MMTELDVQFIGRSLPIVNAVVAVTPARNAWALTLDRALQKPRSRALLGADAGRAARKNGISDGGGSTSAGDGDAAPRAASPRRR